jgi:hypothetical protein
MANTILHKRSATASAVPAAGSLTPGELAVNTADGKVFTKKDNGTVVEIGSAVQSVAGRTGAVTLTKSDVGLANVDNTSDASKPISTATQTALDGKAPTSHNHTASQISDSTTAGRALLTAADAAAQRSSLGLAYGKETIWIPAGAMVPESTSVEKWVTPTQGLAYNVHSFDYTQYNFCHFWIQMPKSWDKGTLGVQFLWAHGATAATYGVVWGITCGAISNNETLDTVNGLANVTVADTGGVIENLYITSEVTLTVGGSPANDDLLMFQVVREYANASDTFADWAGLVGIKILYNTNAGSDT